MRRAALNWLTTPDLKEREKVQKRKRGKESCTCGSNKMAALPLPPRHVGDRAFLPHSLKQKKKHPSNKHCYTHVQR